MSDYEKASLIADWAFKLSPLFLIGLGLIGYEVWHGTRSLHLRVKKHIGSARGKELDA